MGNHKPASHMPCDNIIPKKISFPVRKKHNNDKEVARISSNNFWIPRGEKKRNKTKNSSQSSFEGFLFYVKSPPRTIITTMLYVCIYIYIRFFFLKTDSLS